MERARTRGQPQALAAVFAMIRDGAPHAVLLVGPSSSGKTTLALDLAAGLLCLDPDPRARPCRSCRGCRQVASGNHPDLHWLAPEGPGGQVRIGRPVDPEPGTVRHLFGELALLSVEGGPRIAVVEQAHRLNEDAQNALLKMLEEPPAGVTIVLCADDDERLLPTVRSRCVRLRLGPVGVREIERWLDELGAADAPEAARLARLAAGRPGLALLYARSPDAPRLHAELSRGVLDLLAAGSAARLGAVRQLAATAAELNRALGAARQADRPALSGPPQAAPPARGRRNRSTARGATQPATEASAGMPQSPAATEAPATGSAAAATEVEAIEAPATEPAAAATEPTATAASAAERRAATLALLDVWAVVARDLALISAGPSGAGSIREPDLLEELEVAAAGVERRALTAFLVRLREIADELEENVNPELALDVLALAWPRGPRRRDPELLTVGAG